MITLDYRQKINQCSSSDLLGTSTCKYDLIEPIGHLL